MKKLINFRPALFIAVSVCLGILSASLFIRNDLFFAIATIISFVFIGIVFILIFNNKQRKTVNALWLLVAVLFFILSFFTFYFRTKDYEKANLNGNYYTVTGKIESVTDTSSGSRVIVKNASVFGRVKGKIRYKIAVYTIGQISYDVGDKIEFSAYLTDKSVIYEQKIANYDIQRKIKYTASVNENEIKFTGRDRTIFEIANVGIRDTLKAGLNDTEFSIAYAMLTGYDDYVDENIISSYRQAGVAHIFAVSGLHVGFLAMTLGFVMNKLRLNKTLRAVLITIALIFYSGICSFSASSLRATIMCSIALFASAMGERYDGLSALSLSAVVVLFINPIELFCAGFILSFTVMFGILTVADAIFRLLKFLPQKFAKSLSVVLGAQLFGAPLCLLLFKEFSLIAIIANLIFLPFSGAIFIITLLGTLFAIIFSAPVVALYIPNLLLKIVNALIMAFDYKIFMVGGIAMGGFIILYYFALLVPSGLFNLKAITKTLLSSVLVLAFVVSTVCYNLSLNNQTYIAFSGSNKSCFTIIKSRGKSALVLSSVEGNVYTSEISYLSIKYDIKNLDAIFITSAIKTDMQNLITRLNSVFEFENVYVYNEMDKEIKSAIIISFPEIMVIPIENNQVVLGDIKLTYFINGYAIYCNVNEKSAMIFSELNEMVDYRNIDVAFDYMVAVDKFDLLKSLYKPQTAISYRRHQTALDAESQGDYKIQLK